MSSSFAILVIISIETHFITLVILPTAYFDEQENQGTYHTPVSTRFLLKENIDKSQLLQKRINSKFCLSFRSEIPARILPDFFPKITSSLHTSIKIIIISSMFLRQFINFFIKISRLSGHYWSELILTGYRHFAHVVVNIVSTETL